jgi:hypothetical protein
MDHPEEVRDGRTAACPALDLAHPLADENAQERPTE